MRKLTYLLLAAGIYGDAAMAQTYMPAPSTIEADQASPLDAAIAGLQQEWAIIKYQTPNEERQEHAIASLADKADTIVAQYPDRAEPLIWRGIILATKAGIDGGLGALGDAKAARKSLEEAERLNAAALNGSVYTSLGSLYYKVPGFPIGFGDNKKARAYLLKAIAMNPDGIDPNFFYGDFLYEQGDYTQAEQVLNHGLQAAPRPGRELADKGRAEEIRELLAKVKHKKES